MNVRLSRKVPSKEKPVNGTALLWTAATPATEGLCGFGEFRRLHISIPSWFAAEPFQLPDLLLIQYLRPAQNLTPVVEKFSDVATLRLPSPAGKARPAGENRSLHTVSDTRAQ